MKGRAWGGPLSRIFDQAARSDLEPVDRLLAPASPGPFIERRIFLALAASGQCRGAGGVVAVLGSACPRPASAGTRMPRPRSEPRPPWSFLRDTSWPPRAIRRRRLAWPCRLRNAGSFRSSSTSRSASRTHLRRDIASSGSSCPARGPASIRRAPRCSDPAGGVYALYCNGPRRGPAGAQCIAVLGDRLIELPLGLQGDARSLWASEYRA